MTMAKIDTALACLVEVAAHFSIPADFRQIERAYIVDENAVDTVTLLGAARDIGLKARRFEGMTAARIARLPKPLVARMDDGRYVVIHAANEAELLLVDPLIQKKLKVKLDVFARSFTG